MKKAFYYLSLISILSSSISSCSIEKRLHQGGYFIKWHKHHLPTQEKTIAENPETSYPENSSDIAFHDSKPEPAGSLFSDESSEKSLTEKGTQHESRLLTNDKPAMAVQVLSTAKNTVQKSGSIFQKQKDKLVKRGDSELTINIILTVLFLGLAILFVFLAIPATGTMMYVWWALAAICAILFVTQVIDLILW